MITVRLQARSSTVVCARLRVYAWYLQGGPLAVIGFRVPCHSTYSGGKSQLPIYKCICRAYNSNMQLVLVSRGPPWMDLHSFTHRLFVPHPSWYRAENSCIISTAWFLSEPCYMEVPHNRSRFTHSNTSTMEGNPHLSPSQRGTKIQSHRFLMTYFQDIRISFRCVAPTQ